MNATRSWSNGPAPRVCVRACACVRACVCVCAHMHVCSSRSVLEPSARNGRRIGMAANRALIGIPGCSIHRFVAFMLMLEVVG